MGHLYAIQRGRVRAAKRLSSLGDTPYSPWRQRKITTKTTSSKINTSGTFRVLTAHLAYPICKSGIAHAFRNQSNIATLRQIGSIKITSSTKATPPSITPVIILAGLLITSLRRVLAASSAAFLRRCRSGATGSRVSQASVEAVRQKIMFRRFGFSFDDCSRPTPTSTPSDNGSRLPLIKLFFATSESSGHKVNKSSRFLSVLQVVRFPSELSRIGYISACQPIRTPT